MPATTFSVLINGVAGPNSGGARDTLNDWDSTAYRYSDAALLQYANDALGEIALYRPDLFSRTGEIVCAPGEILQRAPSNALYLLNVLYNRNGPMINKVKREELDRFIPDWPRHPAGETKNWAPYADSPLHFFVYPKPPSGHVIVATWAEILKVYTIDEACPIVGYDNAIRDYIVFRAETRDDESVNTKRAEAFFSMFKASLGITSAVIKSLQKETPREPAV